MPLTVRGKWGRVCPTFLFRVWKGFLTGQAGAPPWGVGAVLKSRQLSCSSEGRINVGNDGSHCTGGLGLAASASLAQWCPARAFCTLLFKDVAQDVRFNSPRAGSPFYFFGPWWVPLVSVANYIACPWRVTGSQAVAAQRWQRLCNRSPHCTNWVGGCFCPRHPRHVCISFQSISHLNLQRQWTDIFPPPCPKPFMDWLNAFPKSNLVANAFKKK